MTKRLVRYEGPAPLAAALAQYLEQQGVHVYWEPPVEERGGIVELVVIPLLVTGSYDAIKAGVRLFLERFPRTKVEIGDEREEPPDDEHDEP